MRKQKQKTISGGYRQNRAPQRQLLWGGTLLCLSLFALHCLGISALGQSWTKKLTVNVAETPAKSVEYRSADKAPPDKTELDFEGNNRDWSLLTFDHLPENVALRVNGKIDGYQESEEIKVGKYYPFRKRLPLVLEIRPAAGMPAEIKYSLGSWATGPVQGKMQDPTATVDEARDYAKVSANVKPNAGPQILNFYWDAPVAPPGASPNASSTPSGSPTPSPEFSWGEYLFDENLGIGIVVVIVGLFVLILSVVFGSRKVGHLMERRRRRSRNTESHGKPKHSSPLDSKEFESGVDTQASPEPLSSTQPVGGPKFKSTVYASDKDRTSRTQAPREDLPPRHAPGDVIEPPSKTSAASATQTAPFNQPQTPALNANAARLEQLINDEVARLRTALDEKADRRAQERLLTEAIPGLEANLRRTEERLEQRLQTVTGQLETMGLEQASLMEIARAELSNRVNDADLRVVRTKDQLVDLFNGVLENMKGVDKRLQARLTELQMALAEQTVPDSFFNKVLGVVLGQNVETLQEGNFERLMGERLNEFFATGVQHGETLQDLRARAEGINSALKVVLVQMEKLNSQASVEARQPLQQFEAFAHDLSGLQTQMQSRRATIETIVHFPVSLHPGARQTFLDELGRGVRREIDKLTDPQKYFESDMERLITTDLISIVDICDKTVAPPPGSRGDLEAALKQLFDQAGLRHILPRQGEPFMTAEQDLIEMAQGAGKSLTVAQVITRGFFYKHRDNETLLRKAGVSVFR
jgi:hypothetical protein